MNEKYFQRELRRDLNAQGARIDKYADIPVSVLERLGDEGLRFTLPKFIDLFGVVPPAVLGTYGVPVYWECKQMKQLHSWPLANLFEEQLNILLQRVGIAEAAVIINYRIDHPQERAVLKLGLGPYVHLRRLNLLTRLLPGDIVKAKERGWKSIPVEQLLKNPAVRDSETGWTFPQIMSTRWEPIWD